LVIGLVFGMTGNIVESTDRGSKDYFYLGLASSGVLIAIVGVVIVSWRTVAFGLAYFGLED